MKFIVTESKLGKTSKKYVINILNNLKLRPIEKTDDGYRIDFDKTSEIDPDLGAFRWSNGILEVSPSILSFFKPFVGVEGIGDYSIIGKWFMSNYGYGVDWVWEWTDEHP